MARRVVGVISTLPYSSMVQLLEEVITDQSVEILLDERQNPAIRFLRSRGFRNVVVYRLGASPKGSHSFAYRSGFLTYVEIEEEIKRNATELY